MKRTLHEVLEELIPHVGDGCQIFIRDQGSYHKFRVVGGQVCHTESHSDSHVEKGRGALERAAQLAS